MASIEIKNIGPLVNTGKIELKFINLFIGKQSTGKSTLMKILSFCCWLEKKIMTEGEEKLSQYTHYLRFKKELIQFHRLNDNFFSVASEIHYEGDCVTIDLVGGKTNAKIKRSPDFKSKRYNTKLSFIPSERNLLSAIKNIDRAYKSNELDSMFNFLFEWGEAKDYYTAEKPFRLSVVSNMEYYYDKEKGSDIIYLEEPKKEFSTYYASSGVQSALPIEVMVDYLIGLIGKSKKVSVSDISRLSDLFNVDSNINTIQTVAKQLLSYHSIKLFIEEPEQNLYPESQRKLVLKVIASIYRASRSGDKPSMITFTTHSPYILSTLNTLMAASLSYEKDAEATKAVLAEDGYEDSILPKGSISAYLIKEDGTLQDIVDSDLQMVSGNELDSVSDWVDDRIAKFNEIIYG